MSAHETPVHRWFGLLGVLGLLLVYAVATSVTDAWDRADWLAVLAVVTVIVGVGGAGLFLARWLRSRALVDPKLVQSKLAGDACEAELRLAVFAPQFVDSGVLTDRLERLAAAYRTFSLAAGNSLVVTPAYADDTNLRVLASIHRERIVVGAATGGGVGEQGCHRREAAGIPRLGRVHVPVENTSRPRSSSGNIGQHTGAVASKSNEFSS